MAIQDYHNIHAMLRETVDRRPGDTAFGAVHDDGSVTTLTWEELYRQVRRAAKSLMALDVGPGDSVTILAFTRLEWILVDLAAVTVGARTVGIYQTLPAREVRYIVDHSDSVLAVVEDREQADKLRSVRDQIQDVHRLVVMEGEAEGGWEIGWDRFLDLGADIPDAELDERIDAVSRDDVASIVYTSGTTGVPKGAMITHDNLTFTAQSALSCLQVEPGDVQLLFLPLAHVFARICVYFNLAAGQPTIIGRSLDTVADDLGIVRPHWFASVPRLYEKVHTKVVSGAEAKGGVALKLFRWAMGVGRKVSEHKQAKRDVPLGTKLQYALAEKLVFSKLQAALGGRVRWCISGAAPLNPDIARFFHAADVLILEGIGMTENTSFTNVNRYDDYRFGWVGTPGPGIEQRIAEDGEILFHGRNVMAGYYKMPEETAETIDGDGWLHTGDLGEIDDRGFLRVTGRKKDLIITAGGKNVAPSAIEGQIATSKYIDQVCVVGDRRKYLAALVTLDEANVAEYAREEGIPFESPDDLRDDERIRLLIEREVDERNRDLASFETIKQVALVPPFTIENGLLTPTSKVKRQKVTERYDDVIDELYPDE